MFQLKENPFVPACSRKYGFTDLERQVVMALIIVSILLIVLGGFLAYSQITKAIKCKEQTTGTIVGVSRKSYSRTRRGRRVEYHPIFEYMANGTRIQSTADISSIFPKKFKNGTEKDLRYNAEKPDEFVIRGRAFLNGNVIGGLFLVLLGIAFIITSFK